MLEKKKIVMKLLEEKSHSQRPSRMNSQPLSRVNPHYTHSHEEGMTKIYGSSEELLFLNNLWIETYEISSYKSKRLKSGRTSSPKHSPINFEAEK